MSWRGIALSVAIVLRLSTAAHAQRTDFDQPAISLERLWLEPGPGSFVAAQDTRQLEPGAWSLTLLASMMKEPIVFSDLQTGELESVPVRLRLGYEMAVARGISERLQLGLGIPVIAAQDGERLQGIGLSEEPLDPVAFGDLRLHGKLRLQPDQSKSYGYGVAFHLALPTGDQDNFAGERGPVLAWTLLAAYRGQGWRVAANLGLRLRTDEVVLLSPARAHGNELIATVAGEYALPASWDLPLAAIGELSKVRGDASGPSPGETRAGIVAYLLPRARLKLVAGGGFTPAEVGAPAWRVAAMFEYEGR